MVPVWHQYGTRTAPAQRQCNARFRPNHDPRPPTSERNRRQPSLRTWRRSNTTPPSPSSGCARYRANTQLVPKRLPVYRVTSSVSCTRPAPARRVRIPPASSRPEAVAGGHGVAERQEHREALPRARARPSALHTLACLRMWHKVGRVRHTLRCSTAFRKEGCANSQMAGRIWGQSCAERGRTRSKPGPELTNSGPNWIGIRKAWTHFDR